MHVRVIDLDGVSAQPPIAALDPTVVPARDLAPQLRLWARKKAMAELADRIGSAGPEPILTFLGSGDFHNVTPLLLRDLPGPLVVVHIDNHPDWMIRAPRYHCGAWVNRALELESVVKVITIGPMSADLDRPDLGGGAFRALADGRIELFAWDRPPSRVLRKLPNGAGHRVEGGKVIWRRLAHEDWSVFCEEVTGRIPADAAVWLTIDKDALRPEDAATNWDQGDMPLHILEQLIATLGVHRRIAGADICGDWSPPIYDTVLKAWEARLDQPQTPPGDLKVNARTNARLLRVLGEVMA